MQLEILISKFQQKDEKAFEELYRMYGNSIHGVIFNIVRDHDIAEEIMQDVFIKAWNNAHSYSAEKGRFFTWILNIARNAAIDQTRSKAFKNSKKNLDAEYFVDILQHSDSLDSQTDAIGIKKFVSQLTSKTGVITKFTDNNLNNLKTSYTVVETRIREINSGAKTTYFYQIEKLDKYGTTTASIEYSDLLGIMKAFDGLKAEVENDVSKNPDYLENKFITDDGFQLGYFVSRGKVTWYIKLEKHGYDKTLFISDLERIQSSFIEAKDKIEELNGTKLASSPDNL